MATHKIGEPSPIVRDATPEDEAAYAAGLPPEDRPVRDLAAEIDALKAVLADKNVIVEQEIAANREAAAPGKI
jgi:hypothetical protein